MTDRVNHSAVKGLRDSELSDTVVESLQSDISHSQNSLNQFVYAKGLNTDEMQNLKRDKFD